MDKIHNFRPFCATAADSAVPKRVEREEGPAVLWGYSHEGRGSFVLRRGQSACSSGLVGFMISSKMLPSIFPTDMISVRAFAVLSHA